MHWLCWVYCLYSTGTATFNLIGRRQHFLLITNETSIISTTSIRIASFLPSTIRVFLWWFLQYSQCFNRVLRESLTYILQRQHVHQILSECLRLRAFNCLMRHNAPIWHLPLGGLIRRCLDFTQGITHFSSYLVLMCAFNPFVNNNIIELGSDTNSSSFRFPDSQLFLLSIVIGLILTVALLVFIHYSTTG